MSALRLIASRIGKMQGGLHLSDPDVRRAMQELDRLGWRKDLERLEPLPPHIRKTTGKDGFYTPWLISPTGESFRGLRAAVLHAAANLPPEIPPSPLALRVVEALRQNPELLAEVQELLSETFRGVR